jgi:hypothetical protein
MATESARVIACNLDALSLEERRRRAELAATLEAGEMERAELGDGYAFRVAPEPSIAHDALEWLLLESRCCPFLRLELSLEPERSALWLRLRGSAEIKAFLASVGLGMRR